MSRPSSVHLGWCDTGFVYTPFMLSVLAWERFEAVHNGRLPSYSHAKHPIVADNRNELVRQFLAHEAQAEWLWVLDPDIQFAPDACANLLAVADPKEAPVVAAAYWNHYDGGQTRRLTWHGDLGDGLRLYKELPPPDKLVEIASCGMGCTLIHRGVFEALREAFPDDPWPWFGHDLLDVGRGPERLGEDVTFCLRARDLGFRIVGHCGVTVDHYKPQFMERGSSAA